MSEELPLKIRLPTLLKVVVSALSEHHLIIQVKRQKNTVLYLELNNLELWERNQNLVDDNPGTTFIASFTSKPSSNKAWRKTQKLKSNQVV